ncbi:MAG: M20/M25/M40 family metallo-hydrolase [Oceanicaulis sp.]|nr:M20/M25/M40 family metallo-hydrolase [Oceanicaulis sp.]
MTARRGSILSAVLAGGLALTLAACGAPAANGPEPVVLEPANLSEAELGERLSRALQFPTISDREDPRASWEAFEGFRAFLAETHPLMFERMQVEDLGYGTLWFTLEGSNAALQPAVFIAHQDVVPVEPGTEDQWVHPPFGGVIADGQVWGRGALDMKGHLITLLSAMESLLEDGFEPVRTIHIGLGHDEEVGGRGAQSMAAWLEARDQRAWFVLDEGGMIIEDSPFTGGPAALIGVAEKGYLTVEVTARARGGHSSTPPDRTAIGLLAEAIDRIQNAPFAMSLEGGPGREMFRALAPHLDGMAGFAAARPGMMGFLIEGELKKEDAGRAMLGTTIAPTVISGGTVANVLPQEARALINLRLHPRDTGQSAIAHMRAAVTGMEGVTVEAYEPWSDPPGVAAMDGPAWDIIAGAAAGAAGPDAPVVPYLMVAATDLRHFAGVADNLYRFMAARMAMADLDGIHGDNERIALSNLPLAADYFRTVIRAAGEDGES